ncbi:Oidioi.mRNA.OKI2018_I69.PAR.g12882.t1.cds [Oikopleura dioica]|uniref:Oidioi.mRNA.OKI2018_I69.PAR.g12882.t1.cds n=1 Tax=Oikopleura dioica TaxID=34765 RepID=A0ABN7S5I7_OIKDI|nr:Oidioi.mRNA.OKI2018_I69.PAR.g12882.t1.cds [Oikopleura dioica]
MSRQLLLTEKDLNISKDDIRRAESIIHEKDEIIKRMEMLNTGAKEHNEQLKNEISILKKELSRFQTEAAGLREDQLKLQSSFAASERRNTALKGKVAQLQSPHSTRTASAVSQTNKKIIAQSGRNTRTGFQGSEDEKISLLVAGYERKCLQGIIILNGV